MEKGLTAILFVLSEGSTWRGIGQPDANWNSVHQSYRRWCREGIWEKVWAQVAPVARPGALSVDATFSKVHRRGLNAAGGRDGQAVGLTKGGWNTKRHAAVDGKGRPWSRRLTAGQVADVSQATEVLQELDAKRVVADKGSDSAPLRIWLFEREVTPCIPPKSNRKDPRPYRRSS
jgi:transposase